MLRRKPTAITLTTEDIAIYEDARAREALLREQSRHQAQQAQEHSQNQNPNLGFRDPSDELRGGRNGLGREKTREERLGLAGHHGHSHGHGHGAGSSRS
ncbi:hypothetical protein G7Y89_g1402 [Cudoniella acicularis]|uniref:Anaphase-promoting complex subunit CDC26 n=1 Tax=Cudoniella acicularis TaxID=354080 RepID=A0A8H4RXB9_9HELO|nr:hypothetical protein G7Y89_g1402 [Cudoniella acicularis]